jgi:tetratricopeptide (TPR) repeat protein
MGKKVWIGIFIVAMAGVAWAAPATEAMIAETQAALDKGDAQHAANLADAALKENISAGERGRLLLYRGLAEELLGSHDLATHDFTTALDTHALPAEVRAQALLQRGFLRDGLGNLDEAAKDYTAVIALKGDSLATALNNRANIYRRQNKLVQAERDYQAALSAGGGKLQYCWYGLGQIAEARADTQSARGFYAKAVSADPGYALASQRLDALGGPPEGAIANPDDRIVLHPPAAPPAVRSATEAAKEADGTVVLPAPQGAVSHDAIPVALHTPRHPMHAQDHPVSAAPAARKIGAAKVVLRPALDQPEHGARASRAAESGQEVQLGAWRSEGEANAGWDEARHHVGGALDGLSPHIVTADLPGRGRYYRLRVSVTAGQSPMAFCADLNARGVACLPARD